MEELSDTCYFYVFCVVHGLGTRFSLQAFKGAHILFCFVSVCACDRLLPIFCECTNSVKSLLKCCLGSLGEIFSLIGMEEIFSDILELQNGTDT